MALPRATTAPLLLATSPKGCRAMAALAQRRGESVHSHGLHSTPTQWCTAKTASQRLLRQRGDTAGLACVHNTCHSGYCMACMHPACQAGLSSLGVREFLPRIGAELCKHGATTSDPPPCLQPCTAFTRPSLVLVAEACVQWGLTPLLSSRLVRDVWMRRSLCCCQSRT